ncbi:hypothetical protein AC579_9201 [Pseudocercospora musae]|uniref:Uncharacterized protein n=1 Tax=Pseudocercospora musae TaxID=113226 RepID=A0A139GTG7_9PEZI|nr:hypothetical protein AC579_9201 [Pseudocercospora musae]
MARHRQLKPKYDTRGRARHIFQTSHQQCFGDTQQYPPSSRFQDVLAEVRTIKKINALQHSRKEAAKVRYATATNEGMRPDDLFSYQSRAMPFFRENTTCRVTRPRSDLWQAYRN